MRTRDRAAWGWLALALAAFTLLPWYALQDGFGWRDFARVFTVGDAGSGLIHALGGRVWLWALPIGLLLYAEVLRRRFKAGVQGALLTLAAGLTLALLVGAGFLIGLRGWSFDWASTAFGELTVQQTGIGFGGVLVLVALLMLAAIGLARRGAFRGDAFVCAAVLGGCALLLLFIALPVGKAVALAFVDDSGALSLTAAWHRLGGTRVWGLGCVTGGTQCGAAFNTLVLALATALGTTVLGTVLALLAERGPRRLDKPLRVLALLPIITPPFVVGLGLILVFGRAGLFNQLLEWAFGVAPSRWFYGFFGIWLAQMFAFTPIAFLIMRGVVQGVSPSLEEAAQTLRADRRIVFATITLPLLKPGLANAFLVGFIESMADFGNPIIVGGSTAVLSTEIFFAIVGAQLDPGRAGALALLLTLFALGAFSAQRWLLGSATYVTVAGKGDSGMPMALPDGVRRAALGVGGLWLAFTLLIYVFAFTGGFVEVWGRDYTPTLRHLRSAFDVQWGEFGIVWAGAAWTSFWTTVKLAALAAPLTAAAGLLIAYLMARTQFRGQSAFEFAALLAFAIPGTVLGVSYVLAFNVPPLELTGTAAIIVLCFLFRNLPVGVRAGTAAFKQLDRSLDEASLMLGASTPTTLWRVTLPLLRPALVAALVYSFVRAMTTVSAVIFLVTAEYQLATTFIIGRVGNGDYGVALAYCAVLIAVMLTATVLIQLLVGERRLGRRAAPVLATA